MTMISDLSHDLVEEILSKVPITCLRAVRSTCKLWNVLSKDRVLCKTDITHHQFIGFMMKEYMICSMRFSLHGLGSSIKEIGNQVEISNIIHCNGLLLCVTKTRRLVVWNPYLGQTRWIQPSNRLESLSDHRYAFGYDNKNKNHKILRYFLNINNRYDIYDFSSHSWRILDIIPDHDVSYWELGACLKGNTYFWAKEKTLVDYEVVVVGHEVEIDEPPNFLLCFDFTRERFGPVLPLPFLHYNEDIGTLSTLRDEKLVVLYQRTVCPEVEIWVTTNIIEPDALLSWTPFLNIDMEPLDRGFQHGLCSGASFFIDEEMKMAVVFYVYRAETMAKNRSYHSVYIIGENGCVDNMDLGDALYRHVPMTESPYCFPLVCSYVPSLVQIN